MVKYPPYLKKGDTIGLTCPAGFMPAEKAQICIDTLQQWGFEVMVGKTLGSSSANYFSGTDQERLDELQAMLDDDSIKAILFGRGGYGVGRIIDRIDFTRFRKSPKWLIGYSDITILHAHVFTSFKTSSIHSPMAAAFNNGEAGSEFILSLRRALLGKKANYKCQAHPLNKTGTATGELVGGNLTLLTHLVGTPSDLVTKKKLLFIEDVGELIYAIDRMFHQLKRSGKLDNLAGLLIGGFTDVRDTERPFGKDVLTVIHDIISPFNYPVCFEFPVSHGRENVALKVGASYDFTVGRKTVRLVEK
jgi:muramoyltetrapeptide carboxypeptidase